MTVLKPGALRETSEQDELEEAVTACTGIAGRVDALGEFLKDDLLNPGEFSLPGRGQVGEEDVQVCGHFLLATLRSLLAQFGLARVRLTFADPSGVAALGNAAVIAAV